MNCYNLCFPSCRTWTQTVGQYFETRLDLRLAISQAIQKITTEEAMKLSYHGIRHGFPDPCVKHDERELENIDDEDDDLPEENNLDIFSKDDIDLTLSSLRSQARVWLPLLLNAFVTTHSSRRNHLQKSISSYACICDPAVVNAVFKSAVARLMKVDNQMKTGELGRDAVTDGGDSDIERYCTYMEAIYALMGGLNVDAIKVIYKIAKPGIKDKEPSIQKKSYKILHYIIEDRADFSDIELQGILSVLLDGSKTALSASRGFRIRCLKAAILKLIFYTGEELDVEQIVLETGFEIDQDISNSVDNARLLMMPMLSEIILSVKESNKKTRAAAFDLLIEVGHAMDSSDPNQGIISMVHLVLGGLVGSTAQMVSASVMALARFLFEFAPKMMGMINDLMQAILTLLRSKAREVIKAVLGFLKVAVMRLNSETLLDYTPKILEGLLIWAEDSKNKFRLKIRVILERLAKKVGFEPLEQNIPAAHKSLLTHIRKQMNRKDRMKHGQSEMDWDGQSFVDSVYSKAKTMQTLAASGMQSDVFSDDDIGKVGTKAKSTMSTRRALSKRGERMTTKDSLKSAPDQTISQRSLNESIDPMNLLEASTSRKMVGMNIRKAGHTVSNRNDDDDIQFSQGDDGRLIIKEESSGKKRVRDTFMDGFDSDDSDIEDIKGISGASLALKGATSIAKAGSYAGTTAQRSIGGTSRGNRKQQERGSLHSGKQFKSKKNVRGDVKRQSKVEPYAYWPLDRKLLNRRQHKTRHAKAGLDKVVNAAKDGALQGQKAKRRRSH